MKRVIFTAAFCLALSAGAFAQMKLVNKVYSEARSEKPNFAEARTQIKEALANPESKDEAKTWYVAGFLENKEFEIERNKQIIGQKPNENKMYSALMAAYDYYLKAADIDQMPNEKGKVKPKYLKSIKETLKNDQSYFINGGAYYWDNKEYQKAYDMFNAFTEIPRLNFFKPEEFKIDSNYHMITYYAALAASQIPNSELTIEKYKALKGTGYKENDIYKYLANEYLTAKDSANYEVTLQEGAEMFPKDPFFVQTLINLYIGKGDNDKAINYLDNAIAQDPNSAELYNVKGGLLEQQGKQDEALALYEKAVEMNPDYAYGYGSIGRIYYNRAIEASDKAANITNQAEYTKERNEVVLPLFKQALPYYEKAHELDPDEKEFLVALRGIYYNLESDKFDEINKKLGY